MTFARNLATALRRPSLAIEYADWLLQSAFRRGCPTRVIRGHVRLGSFANFSEFHSIHRCLHDDEANFFSTFSFGEGAILDVGANIGLVSLFLAHRYPQRAIHAFEPNPSTFLALTHNIRLNGAEGVCCHEIAVADQSGGLLFDADPSSRATAKITGLTSERRGKPVASTTLDDFCARKRIDRVGLLKVDVEGYEALVFRGAGRLLREIRPAIIYFEVCPELARRAGFGADDAANQLVRNGYVLNRLNPDGTLLEAEPNAIQAVFVENWIATPR